jgi:hypothetical protein
MSRAFEKLGLPLLKEVLLRDRARRRRTGALAPTGEAVGDARQLVFVDECGTHTHLHDEAFYARAPNFHPSRRRFRRSKPCSRRLARAPARHSWKRSLPPSRPSRPRTRGVSLATVVICLPLNHRENRCIWSARRRDTSISKPTGARALRKYRADSGSTFVVVAH